MQEEKTVTAEELVKLLCSQNNEFIVHVKLEGEDAGEKRRNIPT